MKIVDRETFLSLPSGTVYAKIPKRWIVQDLCVKYDSLSNDWYYMSFDWVDAHDSGQAGQRMDEMEQGASYPVQKSITRDGLYDDTDQFLIYEEADIRFIVSQLLMGRQAIK